MNLVQTILKFLLPLVQGLNFFPNLKRIVGGLLTFAVGAVAAWNLGATEAGHVELIWEIPQWLKDIVIAVLGIGVAAGTVNDKAKPPSA